MLHTVRRALAIVTILALGLLPGAGPALSAPLVMEPTTVPTGYLMLGGAWDSPCQENGYAYVKDGNSVGVFEMDLRGEGLNMGNNSPVADYDYARISVCGTLLPATPTLLHCYNDSIVRPQFAQGTLDLANWSTGVGETVQLTDIDFSFKPTTTAWGAMEFQASAILADGRAVDIRAALWTTRTYASSNNCWGVDGYKYEETHYPFGGLTVTEAS